MIPTARILEAAKIFKECPFTEITHLDFSTNLSNYYGCQIYLKREDL